MATQQPNLFTDPVLDNRITQTLSNNDESRDGGRDDVEKGHTPTDSSSLEEGKQHPPSDTNYQKSKGVWEMEAMVARITPLRLTVIYGFFILLAYVLSLSTSFLALPS